MVHHSLAPSATNGAMLPPHAKVTPVCPRPLTAKFPRWSSHQYHSALSHAANQLGCAMAVAETLLGTLHNPIRWSARRQSDPWRQDPVRGPAPWQALASSVGLAPSVNRSDHATQPARIGLRREAVIGSHREELTTPSSGMTQWDSPIDHTHVLNRGSNP